MRIVAAILAAVVLGLLRRPAEHRGFRVWAPRPALAYYAVLVATLAASGAVSAGLLSVHGPHYGGQASALASGLVQGAGGFAVARAAGKGAAGRAPEEELLGRVRDWWRDNALASALAAVEQVPANELDDLVRHVRAQAQARKLVGLGVAADVDQLIKAWGRFRAAIAKDPAGRSPVTLEALAELQASLAAMVLLIGLPREDVGG